MFFISAFASVICEFSEKECVEGYFSGQPLDSFREDIESCDVMVKNYKIDFENDVLLHMGLSENRTCIMKNWDEYKITDIYLKGLAYHLSSDRQRIYFNIEVSVSKSTILGYIKYICNTEGYYNNYFDGLFKSDDDKLIPKKLDPKTIQCAARNYVQKKIIDPVKYKIDLQSLESYDCSAVCLLSCRSFYRQLLRPKSIFGLLSDSIQTCMLSTNSELIDHIMSIEVLSYYKIDKDEIGELRKKYIQSMVSVFRNYFECYRSNFEKF